MPLIHPFCPFTVTSPASIQPCRVPVCVLPQNNCKTPFFVVISIHQQKMASHVASPEMGARNKLSNESSQPSNHQSVNGVQYVDPLEAVAPSENSRDEAAEELNDEEQVTPGFVIAQVRLTQP